MFILMAMLLGAFGLGDSSAQSMKKKAGAPIDLDGYKSQPYDYMTAAKDMPKKPILNKYILSKGKEFKEDGEITVKEVEKTASDKDIVADIQKLFRAASGQKIEDATKINDGKKDNPRTALVTIRAPGTGYAGEDGKANKMDWGAAGVIVETKDKKFLILAIGPRQMVNGLPADLKDWTDALKK